MSLMRIFPTKTARSLTIATCLLTGLFHGAPCTHAQQTPAANTDPGAAMEAMLAKLSAKREVQAASSATQALEAADRLVNQPALEGFARALANSVAFHAAALREQAASNQSDKSSLSSTTSQLNDAVAAFRSVTSFPAMRPIKATPGSFRMATDTQAQWADGLLINMGLEKNALQLSDDQVVELQGEDNYIETTLLTRDFPEDDQVTISFWLFPTSAKSEMVVIEGNIAGKFDRWQLTYGIQQQAKFRNEGPSSAYAITPVGSVPLGQWTHIAMTFGRGDEILPALYVNGLLAGKQNEPRDYPLRGSRDKPLRFGSHYKRYPQSHFMLRQVRLWRGMRSAPHIQDDMFKPLTGNEPDLMGYWPLDEGQGTRVQDRSSLAHHGNMQGGRWSPRVQQGQRLSQPIALQTLGAIQKSSLSWQAQASQDQAADQDAKAVVMSAGLSDAADVLPSKWHTLTNGGSIAPLQNGQVPGNKFLWLRQTLTRADRQSPSPSLNAMQLEIISK